MWLLLLHTEELIDYMLPICLFKWTIPASFVFLFSYKHYNSYNKCPSTVLGFEPTTFAT